MFPSAAREWLESGWEQADIFHFGFEGPDNPIFKMYLENCNAFMKGLKQNPGASLTVFEALKWGVVSEPVTSRYVCRPEQSERALRQLISDSFMAIAPRAEALAHELLTHALLRCSAERLLMLEVQEPDSNRRSFDLNLYDLEYRVSDWSELLTLLWDHQKLDKQRLDHFFQANANKLLGHISAGVGRDNRVFFTLYYGVSERCG